ncbi:MAG: TolC family protein [Tannerella sp.]|jgi:outer membrane protein TolC|nr:TolC family protein [Tannerella sp.]
MNKCLIIAILFSLLRIAVTASGQESDSLSHYLKTAAENSPAIKAAFHTYEAALQKAPQMGAYEDPQLDIGFFLEPMNIVDGRQIAQFQLMQMFPWFGTRKAARTEALHMAKMSFEQFRETRDNLYLEIYTQWYILCALQQKRKNTEENRILLKQLEALALQKFSSGGGSSGQTPDAGRRTPDAGNSSASSGSMGGMNMGAGQPAQSKSPAGNSGTASAMGAMQGGMGSASSGMSEVLRIQLEIVELESAVESILSEMVAEKARFNALLNRPAESGVIVPDTFTQIPFILDVETTMQTLSSQNPMLGMIREETLAYKARLEMEKKMGYPMFGIGLQYMLIGKNPESVNSGTEIDMGAMSVETDNPANGINMKSMNGKDMFMPMVSVTIPLYRNKYKAARRESKFLQQANEEKYIDTHNQLQAELYRFKHRLDDARRKIQLYQKQAELAHTTCELVVQEFATGKSDLSAVIQVQRQLLDYELKESEAVAGYNTLVANIRKLISSYNDNI